MNVSSIDHMVRRLQSLLTQRAPAWRQNELRQNCHPPTFERPGRLASASLLAVVSAAVIFARRPDQFLHPYIWVEEGYFTLRFYADSGWSTLLEPLAGYFLTASKLIDLTAFQLSIQWAPEIAAALAVAFTCAVSLAVALSPTHLRWRYACALAALLVPSHPEVFGTGAYTFWWAGLLLPLTVLWTDERQWLRRVYLVVGGLSSPLIGTITVLLALRVALERNRREMIATLIAGAATLVQLFGMRAQMAIGVKPVVSWPTPVSIPGIAQKFVGAFFHADSLPAGMAIAIALAFLAWVVRRRLDRYFGLLVLLFLTISFTITMRLGPGELAHIGPFANGARYFFYPFILLGWILIWLASISPRIVQGGLAAGCALSLVLAGARLSWRHDGVDWKYHVLTCARTENYELPIHYLGSASDMWHAKFTGAQCRSLLARSLF
jgi:hypothetical protein